MQWWYAPTQQAWSRATESSWAYQNNKGATLFPFDISRLANLPGQVGGVMPEI